MTMFHLFIYAISIFCAIHGIQTRSIQNDTLENRIVALEKLVEKLEDRIRNGTNSSKEGLFVFLFVCLMVLSATFNNIAAISWRSVLMVEETEVPEKTTVPSQVTDKLHHTMLFTSPLSRFELKTSVVIGTDSMSSCKSNYHTITTTKVLC
jgi:hypothetical protein